MFVVVSAHQYTDKVTIMVHKVAALSVIFLIVIGLLYLVSQTVYAPEPSAKMMVEKNELNIGALKGEGSLDVWFNVRNDGDCPLRLKRNDEFIQNDCVDVPEECIVKPGETTQLVVKIQKEKLGGPFRIEVPFTSNDSSNPEYSFFVKGNRDASGRYAGYQNSMQARFQRD